MRRITLFLAVLCLAIPLFAADTVAGFVERHESLQLGDTKSVTNFTVSVGHATFTLPSGTVSTVLAGSTPAGLFLHGAGTFHYESANKDEFSAIRYNAKDADIPVTVTADKATFDQGFTSVVLRGNGLPAVNGTAAAADAAALAELRQLFDRQQFVTPPAHTLAMQALNAPDARIVYAEVNGPRPYVYLYDEAWQRDETLTLVRRFPQRTGPGSDWMLATQMSKQAIGRDNRDAAPANAMLTSVDVTLVNTKEDEATLTVVETVVPQGRAASALLFDLYDEYLYDMTRAPRKYNLRSVTDGAGKKLSFDHRAGSLVVGLAEPAPAGKPVTLKFEIDGNILHRPDNSNFWQLGIEPWFPSLKMNELAYTYHAVVKVKKPFVPFTSGKQIRREVEGDWNVIETKLEQPVSAVAILAGRYQFDEETRNGVTVRVASFMSKNERAWKQLRSIAFAAIEHYPNFLGPFPLDEINILEKNDFGYGQAPAGIIFITKEAFTPMRAEANEWIEGINMRLAHEIAHQYWGTVVKMPSYEEQWIEEAFAEYSAALFMLAAKRQKEYDRAFIDWKTYGSQAAKVATIPTANSLVNFGDPAGRSVTRQGLIYYKGAMLLAALHRELGDQVFGTFLKSYQKSFRWKTGSTKDIIGLLNFITKKDWQPWFEQYYYGSAMPEITKK